MSEGDDFDDWFDMKGEQVFCRLYDNNIITTYLPYDTSSEASNDEAADVIDIIESTYEVMKDV